MRVILQNNYKILIFLGLIAFGGLFYKVLRPVFYIVLISVLILLGIYLYSKPVVKNQVDPFVEEVKKVAEKPINDIKKAFFKEEKDKKAKQAVGLEKKEKLAWVGRKIGIKAKSFFLKVGHKIEDKIANLVVYGLFIAVPVAIGWIILKFRTS